jgi:hypothetical protein
VKQGIVSASTRASGVHHWFLDAHGNPGFSGGRVVARTQNQSTMQVAAVIAGNRAVDRPVFVASRRLEETVVRENTGIVIATDIKHLVDTIEAETAKGH